MQYGWPHDKRVRIERAFYEFLDQCWIFSRESSEPICLGKSLYEGQRQVITEIFDALERDVHKIYILKSRQLGISTIIRALIIFLSGLYDGVKGAVVFDTDPNKQQSRSEIATMIENFPDEYNFPKIEGNHRAGMTLSNKSQILFMSAGVRKTKSSGTLGRSVGLSLAALSELCSYDNDDGLEAFEQSLSDENPDRLYIYESTARGPNRWKEIWEEARKDTLHCHCIFLGWYTKPSQQIPNDHPDFERYGTQLPTDRERKKIREVEERYGYTITPEKLAWIRRKLDPTAGEEGDAEAEYEGSVARIQEQPWCVTANTRVGTERGIIPIVEAATCCELTSRGKIINGGPTGKARIWRVRTKLGYEFTGTANHPIITVDNKQIDLSKSLGARVRLQMPMLSTEDHVVSWRDPPIVSQVKITPELARFIGLFMGDGSASKYSKAYITEVAICCDAQDVDVIVECENLFSNLFGIKPSLNPYRGWVSVRTGKNTVFKVLEQLGLLRTDIGKTMRKVHVPDFIWRSPKHVIKEFLSGLFEADGYNSTTSDRVAIYSKYSEFIRDIQLLLLAFGITSRAVSMKKTNGEGRVYRGCQLELRTAEAIKFNEEIGFLSTRKKEKYNARRHDSVLVKTTRRPPIVLEDVVELVEDTGIVDDVWNLTIEGEHLFDANGILTHNTEEESWQLTGSIFFPPPDLTKQLNKYISKKYSAHMFACGIEFTDMRVYKAPNPRSVELKVWEEPNPSGVYVVSADVAFGSNENNDRSAIQVCRCFADGLDQVAEYAWPLIGTRQFAWVILALAAWYSSDGQDVYLIVELNGPGRAVWDEITFLRHHIAGGYQPKEVQERGLSRIFQNVKNYIYSRPDSMSSGKSWQWQTNAGAGPSGKVRLMERMRDFIASEKLHIRSLDTLKEMEDVTREGDSIEAQGRKKDDRVVSLSLAVRCFEDRVQKRLGAALRTREVEKARVHMNVGDQAKLFSQYQFESFLNSRRNARRKALIESRRVRWR